jgi:glycosyltransferase involved in cell wall biosynthesis
MLPKSQNHGDVDVLLATCNGAEFLEKQLESLFSQTCQDFSVRARDDCSTDETVSILERYARRYPHRFIYTINAERLGAAANFAALLCDSAAPYIMCCDQDDVWLSDKVALTLARLRTAEQAHGLRTPVLVYSDAVLVDAKLGVISPSFWRKCKVRPREVRLRHLLAQNLVTGCTMGCNRALLERALPIPINDVVMHDYWLALVAASFGVMVPIRQATVLYRQHGKNTLGILPDLTFKQSMRRLVNDTQLRTTLLAAIRQARAFSLRFAADLSHAQKAQLAAFQALFERGYVLRRWMILRYGLLRTGFWNNIGYLVRV